MPSMKEELDQSTTPPLYKTGCGFYINKETGGFCSSCYKADALKNKASSEVPKILGVNNNVDNQEPVENQDQSNEVVKKRNRCHVFNKRVGLVPFLCRCGESFCALHRMPKKHACKFDFGVCNKRVGLVPFLCRCGERFCVLHRMPKKHACKFEFKAAGRVVIEKHNPLCVADKLEFRCGESFCALHRMPEKHACKFDFKAAGRVVIETQPSLCG
nr:putative zinc finger A20 and AN1 domain-containing stress-associated protein 8 [Tanacetum cinerariifolium]